MLFDLAAKASPIYFSRVGLGTVPGPGLDLERLRAQNSKYGVINSPSHWGRKTNRHLDVIQPFSIFLFYFRNERRSPSETDSLPIPSLYNSLTFNNSDSLHQMQPFKLQTPIWSLLTNSQFSIFNPLFNTSNSSPDLINHNSRFQFSPFRMHN
ncbi:hypothetical protein QVD17_03046 [Tagetes erecta]|uniref:Uncharacterized protein n=1 Tax=Tagetes erecta TaxID=13708 RepID=A0AAD8L9B6_TARER|nr:hypothetical protein QVD17_03046 [Tagetes erecta]